MKKKKKKKKTFLPAHLRKNLTEQFRKTKKSSSQSLLRKQREGKLVLGSLKHGFIQAQRLLSTGPPRGSFYVEIYTSISHVKLMDLVLSDKQNK